MSSLRQSYGRVSDTKGIVLRSATDDGIIGLNHDAAVDGSITPVKFWVQPLPNEFFELTKTTVGISDSGNPSVQDYGSIVGPLANGIQFFIELNGQEILFGPPIDSNVELINRAPEVQEIQFSGSVRLRVHTFDLLDHTSRGVTLNGATNDKFGVVIRDDLSSLVTHTFTIKGYSFVGL